MNYSSHSQSQEKAYHLSGFGEWYQGGRRDLKPDYRMFGLGSKEYSKLYLILKFSNHSNQYLKNVRITHAILSLVLIKH
jgi:hypothetical protein